MARKINLDSLFLKGDSKSKAMEKYVEYITADSALTYQERDKEVALIQHGKKFKARPGKERLDGLSRIILETMASLGEKPTAREIWEALPILEEKPGILIQEREDDGFEYDKLFWLADRRGKETTFGSFKNRITRLRKKSSKK